MSEIGLRERKKRRMYRTVSDTAVRLFLERGFDAVSVGVVAADADVPRLRRALVGADPEVLDERVAVVPASLVKGLEYDHVVAVEPAAIAEAEERGPHRLYVVLTRAVSRLEVVRARELPF